MSAILVAVKDLLFASKIDASARAIGVEVSYAPRSVPLRVTAAATRPGTVIVDLGEPGILAEIESVKRQSPTTHVIGFVSHVRTELIEAAEAIGVDEVMTRGQLSARLDEILLRPTGPA